MPVTTKLTNEILYHIQIDLSQWTKVFQDILTKTNKYT